MGESGGGAHAAFGLRLRLRLGHSRHRGAGGISTRGRSDKRVCYSQSLNQDSFHRYDELDDIRSLYAAGVSLDSKDEQGITALHMAAVNGHLDVVEFLLNKGLDADVCNQENNTPLHWACLNGRTEVIESLIMAGANVSALFSHDRTPIVEALSQTKTEIDVFNMAVAQLELCLTSVSS
ncbi:Ankyrin-2-like protein [Drosera capensis]